MVQMALQQMEEKTVLIGKDLANKKPGQESLAPDFFYRMDSGRSFALERAVRTDAAMT